MFEIRAATAADLPAIVRIQDLSPEASGWNPLDFECRVALLDGAIAGFIAIRRTGPDEGEILNLAVHPGFRRRGIAKALLSSVLQTSPGEWFLEVRESNAAAIALYSACGFVPSGRRENYYENPAEAAIVMRFFS
jgi:ribosomal-protein-alanine N-acetyltransferase